MLVSDDVPSSIPAADRAAPGDELRVEPVPSKRTSRAGRRLRSALVTLDLAGAMVCWLVVLGRAGPRPAHTARSVVEAVLEASVLGLATVALNALQHLYRSRVCSVRSVELRGVARASAAVGLGAYWLDRLHYGQVGASTYVLGSAVSLLAVATLRVMYSGWVRAAHIRGRYCRPVCVIGSNEEAELLVDLLAGQPELGFRVVAVIGDTEEWAGRRTGVPARQPDRDVARVVREAGATGVIVAASAVDGPDQDPLIRQLVADGLHVQITTGLARVGYHRMRAYPLSHQLTFYVERPTLSSWQRLAKRTIDLFGASVVLLLSSPLLAAAALAVKMTDGGPVFYRQERVGLHGRPFKVLKLRTMVPDASAQLAGLMALNQRNGPLFKLSNDPRVTRVGRLLRSTSIDELPQLFNVVRGQMSLVGPRPALAEEVAQFDPALRERTSVPPGITGLWQIEARDNPSFHAYRRLDLFYVDNWSVLLDLTILATTFWVVAGRAIRTARSGAEVVGGAERIYGDPLQAGVQAGTIGET